MIINRGCSNPLESIVSQDARASIQAKPVAKKLAFARRVSVSYFASSALLAECPISYLSVKALRTEGPVSYLSVKALRAEGPVSYLSIAALRAQRNRSYIKKLGRFAPMF